MFLTFNHQVDATFGPANSGVWGVKQTALGRAIVHEWLSLYDSKGWYFNVSMQRWAYLGESANCNVDSSCFQYNAQGPPSDAGRDMDVWAD